MIWKKQHKFLKTKAEYMVQLKSFIKSFLFIIIGICNFNTGMTQSSSFEHANKIIKIPSEKSALRLNEQTGNQLKLVIDNIAIKKQKPIRLNYFTNNYLHSLEWISFRLNKEICIINMNEISKKFIGETEKNLDKIFNKATQKNWILFFDEADALFGKRTQVKDAHDKYANQEVSYFLTRLKEFDGDVIIRCREKKNSHNILLKDFTFISNRD
ncbi:MAG: AAA family ATPase [Chitinophagaceae bacterium]|nr:AAA family ATPase [Chitinophagaceae bacterium]